MDGLRCGCSIVGDLGRRLAIAGLVLALASCGGESKSSKPDASAGGAMSAGRSASGPATGGARASTAGSTGANTGGAGTNASTGGSRSNSGGAGSASASTGGAGGSKASTGGTTASTGGAKSSTGGATASTGGAGAHQATLRIMPLGDSITETTCVTQLLDKELRDGGHSNFDLVGTHQNQQSCGVDNPDRDCEGHSGYLVTDLVGNGAHAGELAGWCSTDRADVVVMHFGTNDVWSSVAPAMILSAFSTVIDALRAVQPNVIVFVAQIIPMNPSGCSECAARVQTLNAQIPGWAMSKSTQASPIYVVDQWTGFDDAMDTGDGVHPNPQGSQKMADAWTAALLAHGVL